ncbi:hypothetical protein L1887_63376 [Cichorium endivia]|nr:hypothetical protein L1887_63376 [Cichorium endivia]
MQSHSELLETVRGDLSSLGSPRPRPSCTLRPDKTTNIPGTSRGTRARNHSAVQNRVSRCCHGKECNNQATRCSSVDGVGHATRDRPFQERHEAMGAWTRCRSSWDEGHGLRGVESRQAARRAR